MRGIFDVGTIFGELFCDEDVVMELSYNERKEYGDTILNMMERANEQSSFYLLGAFFLQSKSM